MNKLQAIFQLVLAAISLLVAIAMTVNFLFIVFRPNPVSVVNVMVATVLIVACSLAFGRIMLKRGLSRLRDEKSSHD
ncbi:MAG: hypothetical protein WDZ76_00145 [Pseudohongiellaceae bacterium]